METWSEFETRFKDLVPRLQSYRIDDQTGAAGEYWKIAGGNTNTTAKQEFEILCDLAGKKLLNVLPDIEEFQNIIDHSDSKIRWYRLLKKISTTYTRDPIGYQTEEDGSSGAIYGGTIHNIADASANLALWLEANHPIKQHWAHKIYDDYGKAIIIGIILLVITTIFAA